MATTPQFRPRARFCGSLTWLCPHCGHVNRHRVDRTGWRLRCKAKECRRRFTFGLTLYTLAGLQGSGRKVLPPPDLTFPLVPLESWHSGTPVHQLVQDAPEEARDAG